MLIKALLIRKNKTPVSKWFICVLLIGISAVVFSRPVDAHLAPLAEQSFGGTISNELTFSWSDVEEGFVLKPGQKAPTFQLEGLSGGSYSLTHKPAKPVLINFWASWCDPCRLEAPILNRLYDQYNSRLEIFGVNVTKYDRHKDVKQFVASLDLKYSILMDQRGEVFSAYKGMAFPMSILVGTDGRIKEVMLGMFHEDELEARILKVLDAEKQASAFD